MQRELKQLCHNRLEGYSKKVTVSAGSNGSAGGPDAKAEGLARSTAIEVDVWTGKKGCTVWQGGSIMAQHPDFQGMCVSAKDYAEYGSSICHRWRKGAGVHGVFAGRQDSGSGSAGAAG